jgi:mannan polymerase II complex MNN11 subunit
MAKHPRSKYFFHLSPHALIMNPTKSLKSHLLDRSQLESLMMKELPVVPPDSIIKTLGHLKEKDIDLIISQDSEDLCPGSFVLKNGDFARFFLDLWFDPLYRQYNFAKAEVHGLVRHPLLMEKWIVEFPLTDFL